MEKGGVKLLLTYTHKCLINIINDDGENYVSYACSYMSSKQPVRSNYLEWYSHYSSWLQITLSWIHKLYRSCTSIFQTRHEKGHFTSNNSFSCINKLNLRAVKHISPYTEADKNAIWVAIISLISTLTNIGLKLIRQIQQQHTPIFMQILLANICNQRQRFMKNIGFALRRNL